MEPLVQAVQGSVLLTLFFQEITYPMQFLGWNLWCRRCRDLCCSHSSAMKSLTHCSSCVEPLV